MATVEVLIKARNLAAAELRALDKSVKGVDSSISTAAKSSDKLDSSLRNVGTDAHGRSRGLGKISRDFDAVDKSASKAARASSGVRSAIGGLAGLGIGSALSSSLSAAAQAANEANKVAAQTDAVLKSTGGAAGVTAQQVSDLAGAISAKTGIDDEAIQSGQNLLLTFTGIKNEAGAGNDIFNQATAIMTDMSAAMGTDASGSAIQLGKALNDPTKGITALTRVGVTFTDAQKEQIKQMQAAGDTAGAQRVILAELRKEFGGSAEAQATALDKANVYWGNLQETLGNKVLPVMESLGPAMMTIGPSIQIGGAAAGAAAPHMGALATQARAASLALMGPAGLAIGVGIAAAAMTAWAVDKHSDEVTRLGREAGLTAEQIAKVGGDGASAWEKLDTAIEGAFRSIGIDNGAATVETFKELNAEVAGIGDKHRTATGSAQGYYRAIENGTLVAQFELGKQAMAFDPLTGRVVGLTNAATRYGDAIGKTITPTQDAKNRVADLDTRIDTLTGRVIGAAEATRTRINPQFFNLRDRADAARGKISDLNLEIGDIGTEQGIIRARIGRIDEAITVLEDNGEKVPARYRQQLRLLQAQDERLVVSAADATLGIIEQEGKVEVLQDRMKKTPATVTTQFNARTGKANQDIDATQRNINNTPDKHDTRFNALTIGANVAIDAAQKNIKDTPDTHNTRFKADISEVEKARRTIEGYPVAIIEYKYQQATGGTTSRSGTGAGLPSPTPPRTTSPATRPRTSADPAPIEEPKAPTPVVTKTAPIDTPYMQKWFGNYGNWPDLPEYYWGKPHPGMDVTGETNDVFAPESGRVQSKWDIGLAVQNGSRTHVLHHLVNMQVQQGQQVRVGQYLGDYAKVGNSTGAHLHWEIHKNPWDPFLWNSSWQSDSLMWAQNNRAAYDAYRHQGGPIAPNRRYIVKNDESVVLTGKTGAGYVQPHDRGRGAEMSGGRWDGARGGLQPVILFALAGRDYINHIQGVANPPAGPHEVIRALQSAGRWD